MCSICNTRRVFIIKITPLEINKKSFIRFVTEVYFWIPLMWFVVFFGACIVPPCYGVVVSCVPRYGYKINLEYLSKVLINDYIGICRLLA
jgi:hypothetical protein